MMDHVFFKPWIGKNYQSGGIFPQKILVVGESHYCGGCEECGLKYKPQGCEAVNTIKTIRLILDGYTATWTPTYRKFERSLVNKGTTLEESNEIWESIAFYNFLQIAMNEARESGTREDYLDGQPAFLEVINELQPELIVVWGVTKLYKYLPEDGWIEGERLEIDGYNVKNGYYVLRNGQKSRIIFVYHPSTGYSWDRWYKVISSQFYVNKRI